MEEGKTKIKAEIVGHSLSPQGDELISVLCTFPRIILAEVNTHRMLSKNTSSSRAIPFKKMVESVQNDPFTPIAWQSKHSGMQGSEYLTGSSEIKLLENKWLEARDLAVQQATLLENSNVTKQLCNRLLEPFMWTTMLITGSREGWENFFNLRCPVYIYKNDNSELEFSSKEDWIYWRNQCVSIKNIEDVPEIPVNNLEWLAINKGQAEIHMMALAEEIYDAMNESTPKQLQAGEWHIPFEDKIDLIDWLDTVNDDGHLDDDLDEQDRLFEIDKVKISTAMAAHTSYTTVGNEPVKSYEKWIELHDKLIAYDPPHSSPMEHCARAMSDEEYECFLKGERKINKNTNHWSDVEYFYDYDKIFGWCNNLKGFIPYRYFIDNNLTF